MKKVIATLIMAIPMFAQAQINLNSPPTLTKESQVKTTSMPVGKLTKEAEHRNRLFTNQDANGDNYISKQELAAHMNKMHAHIKSRQLKGTLPLIAPTQEDVFKIFEAQDANKDGRISKEEHENFTKNVYGM